MPGIPILQVRGNGFVQYCEPMFTSSHINGRLARARMLSAKKQAYGKGLSEGSKKRLTRAITVLCQACKPRWVKNYKGEYQYFRMSFITLNFSCKRRISPELAKQLFEKFTRWIREVKGSRADLWKLEFQKKGQPHFHMLSADYFHYLEIRKKWNSIQHEAGLLDEYAMEYGHFDPNSTDIHQVKNVKDLASYMIKELAKDIDAKRVALRTELKMEFPDIDKEELNKKVDEKLEAALKVNGKVWDCSQNVRGVKYFSVVMCRHHEAALNAMYLRGELTIDKGDFFAIIKLKGPSPPDILNDQERKNLNDHVGIIFQDPARVHEVEADLIDSDLNTELEMTWEQLQINFN